MRTTEISVSTVNWSRENLAWLAGIWEGEGCLYHGKQGQYSVFQMQLHTTDQDVARSSLRIAGCGTFYTRQKNGGSDQYKLLYGHRISRAAHVYAVCVAIYPFMHSRRAAKIRDLIDTFSGRVLVGT